MTTLQADDKKNTLEKLAKAIKNRPARSAWAKGIAAYALELIEEIEDFEGSDNFRKKALMNGAQDWHQYSEGGCALIYDADIAERLCTPSELKRTKGGDRHPGAGESWIDCQARALSQACRLILSLARRHDRIADLA